MTEKDQKSPLRDAVKGSEEFFMSEKKLMSANLPEGDYRKGPSSSFGKFVYAHRGLRLPSLQEDF